uniref:Uncharacterized protein n=1 Tax=Rhizophora mucronata TaxID=61149 RepID=A0A2P2R2C8_RHIMU
MHVNSFSFFLQGSFNGMKILCVLSKFVYVLFSLSLCTFYSLFN